jgi:uncharacterized membrane protein
VTPRPDVPQRIALAAIAALALSELLWEWAWAPIRPGGSWLALKSLPLALCWAGCVRGSLRAWRVALLLLPLYFGEAVVAAATREGRARIVALWAAGVAALAFAAAWAFMRKVSPRRRFGP